MATKYWVGGDGVWSSLTNWRTTSGGAVVTTPPGAADAARLDSNSGASVVIVDSNITVQTLTCSTFTGTLAFGTNTVSVNSTDTVFTGSLTMTVTGTPLIICTNVTATARTISPLAVSEANSISFRITGGTGTFALSANSAVKDLDFTDGVNPTGYGGAQTGNTSFTIYGNFTASTNMTKTAGVGVVTFAATSGTKTIITAEVLFDCPFTFNGVGGTWQIQDNLTMGSTRTVTLTNGTLDLNNQVLSTGLFNTSNSNIRTLAFGTGSIALTGSGATIWNGSTSTNLTVTGSKTINCTYSGATGTRILNTSAALSETNAYNVNVTAGTDTVSLQGRYYTLNTTGFTGTIAATSRSIYGSLTIGAGATYTSTTTVTSFIGTSGSHTITTNGVTIDGAITFDGSGGTWTFADALTQGAGKNFIFTNGTVKLKNSATSTVGAFSTTGTNQKFLMSSVAGSQATLSQASGTVSASYLTIKDINATGGATWDAFVDQNNIDAGNVDGWNFGISPVVGGNEYTYQLRSFTQPRRF